MQLIRLLLWMAVAVAVALFVLGAIAAGGRQDSTGLRLEAALLRIRAAFIDLGADFIDLITSDIGTKTVPGVPLGGAFALVNHRGEPVTEAIFREQPSVTLFGFTHCPDVCPTGLMEMTRWAEELGPDAEKLRFLFVTVDPERDTPATMGDYVSAFSDRIVGISGEPEKVHAMVKDYKIFSRKVVLEGGDYTMDHTASMILQDEEGNFVGTIARDEASDTAMAKLRKLVAG